jgi:hypothetical protein
MKISIIRADGAVYKDGISYSNLDLFTVPENIHALQFNDILNVGWIEFVEDEYGVKTSNETIVSLPSWAFDSLIKWEETKTAEEEAFKIKIAEIKKETTSIVENSSVAEETTVNE